MSGMTSVLFYAVFQVFTYSSFQNFCMIVKSHYRPQLTSSLLFLTFSLRTVCCFSVMLHQLQFHRCMTNATYQT